MTYHDSVGCPSEHQFESLPGHLLVNTGTKLSKLNPVWGPRWTIRLEVLAVRLKHAGRQSQMQRFLIVGSTHGIEFGPFYWSHYLWWDSSVRTRRVLAEKFELFFKISISKFLSLARTFPLRMVPLGSRQMHSCTPAQAWGSPPSKLTQRNFHGI